MSCGGAEALIMNVYRRLDRERFQFDFAVGTSRKCFYDDEIISLGGRIFHLPAPIGAGVVSYLAALRSTIRQQGPFAAIHSHVYHFTGAILQVIDPVLVPLRVAHSHSMQDGHVESLGRRVYRWSMRRFIRQNASHLLGCSRQVCELVYGPHCWSDSRVTVLPNAIEPERFSASQPRDPELRRELDVSPSSILVGHVGSFRPAKNHRHLLRIFSTLVHSVPSAQLVLVGDGPLRSEMETSATELGIAPRVHFLGQRRDVPRILGALDLMLFPSLYEGMPTALVEAQAAGLHCVVSDRVTREADLGIGLVNYVSLAAPEGAWASHCTDALRQTCPPWPERLQAIRNHGYDIQQSVHKLESLYNG
jgi:glycosyltransferase involved in cell wall biosynthesis